MNAWLNNINKKEIIKRYTKNREIQEWFTNIRLKPWIESFRIYDSYFDHFLVRLINPNHLFRRASINHRFRSSHEISFPETSSISLETKEERKEMEAGGKREKEKKKNR